MRNFTRLQRGWSVLCHVLLAAVTGLSALSGVSCRSARGLERVELRENTVMAVSTADETVETVMAGMPGDTVSLRIPMESIWSLPEGAVFTKKKGRTRLTLKPCGDAVVVEAETDSVGREIRHYERKARDSLGQRGGTTLRERPAREDTSEGRWAVWVLVGMVGVTVIIRVFK